MAVANDDAPEGLAPRTPTLADTGKRTRRTWSFSDTGSPRAASHLPGIDWITDKLMGS